MRFNWLCIGIIGVCFVACAPKTVYQYAEGGIYGTFYHISYQAEKDMHAELRDEMEKVNASLSMFNPASLISRINRGECDTTDVLFRRMFAVAGKVYKETGGAYDITVAPLVNAWGFGYEKEEFPDSLRIDSLLQLVGMDKLTLHEGRLSKKVAGMQLDASSIAKGLGVDLVADYLESHGVNNYMVEIGGEVRMKGISNKQRPWRIGIDCPEDDPAMQSRELQMILALDSGALATSGNYRNFYVRDGKKYAHTIHPATGYPVQTEVLSASVYTGSCMEADAYATAFMVLGLEKAKAVIEGNSNLEVCLIYVENDTLKTWISGGLAEKIVDDNR